MYQNDTSIVGCSNIQTDVVIINQCNRESIEEFDCSNNGKQTHMLFISTRERGLSRSRNMALKKSNGDICLICDDDEILCDDYEEKIIKAFEEQGDADIIAFQIDDAGKVYPKRNKRLSYLGVLKVASWQIAFKRESIIKNNICFDETVGSGVSKAGGEENIFLYECLKKGLNIYFVPITIGKMIQGESQWFNGYTADYFVDRGKFTRKMMGLCGASIYAFYYLIFKYPLYRKDIAFQAAFRYLFTGIFEK